MKLNLILLITNAVQFVGWTVLMFVLPHTSLANNVLFTNEVSLWALSMAGVIAALSAYLAIKTDHNHQHLEAIHKKVVKK